MNPVQRLLNRIFVMVTWQPLLTIFLAVVLAGLSIAYTVHDLGFETSQRDLLSRNNKLVKLAEGEGNGFGQAQSSLAILRKTIARVQEQFPGVRAGVTGQKALNDDEMTLAMRDMSLATTISMVGLTLLLIIFWGTLRLPVCEMIELTVSLSLTFGLTTLVVGHLNILSVVFAPLLLGLGIDYGIHWLARYQEEEQAKGRTREEAVRNSMINLGPGIILAGMAASLSFFPLILTGFKGLMELGIICSMGMVTTTLTTTVGFSSLMISCHQGIHSLGLLATVGSLSVVAAAVLFLPAMLQLLCSISDRPHRGIFPPYRAKRRDKKENIFSSENEHRSSP